jgi:hypothetical protein
MNKRQLISTWALVAVCAISATSLRAQQSAYEQFRATNASMAPLQPSRSTPVVEADPRLVQYVRFSFSHEYAAAGNETMNFGNARGFGLVGWNRIEFDYAPPSYIQHNSSSIDGFGDTSVSFKYRIASGGAEYGNYILTTILGHTFATGSHKNGALTDCWSPTLAGGVIIFKRFPLVSTLGGGMPTGKIAMQGRSIVWNSLAQAHATAHLTLEVEDNSTFYFAGANNGKMQNFVTPSAYYLLRPKRWKPTHDFLVVAAGMQIATSGFHTYNHNLISELRLMF